MADSVPKNIPGVVKAWTRIVALAWLDENDFKQRLLNNSHEVLEEHGIEIPNGITVKVEEVQVEQSTELLTLSIRRGVPIKIPVTIPAGFIVQVEDIQEAPDGSIQIRISAGIPGVRIQLDQNGESLTLILPLPKKPTSEDITQDKLIQLVAGMEDISIFDSGDENCKLNPQGRR